MIIKIKKILLFLIIMLNFNVFVSAQTVEIKQGGNYMQNTKKLELDAPEIKNYHNKFKKYLKKAEFGKTICLEIENLEYYGYRLYMYCKKYSFSFPLDSCEPNKILLNNGNYLREVRDRNLAIEYNKNDEIVGLVNITLLKNTSKEIFKVFHEYKIKESNNKESNSLAELEHTLFLHLSRDNNKLGIFLYDKDDQIFCCQIDNTLYTNNPNIHRLITLNNVPIEEFDEKTYRQDQMHKILDNPILSLPIFCLWSFPLTHKIFFEEK